MGPQRRGGPDHFWFERERADSKDRDDARGHRSSSARASRRAVRTVWQGLRTARSTVASTPTAVPAAAPWPRGPGQVAPPQNSSPPHAATTRSVRIAGRSPCRAQRHPPRAPCAGDVTPRHNWDSADTAADPPPGRTPVVPWPPPPTSHRLLCARSPSSGQDPIPKRVPSTTNSGAVGPSPIGPSTTRAECSLARWSAAVAAAEGCGTSLASAQLEHRQRPGSTSSTQVGESCRPGPDVRDAHRHGRHG